MLIVVHLASVVLPPARDCVLAPDLPHFDLVADLEPFCAGWASFMERLYEQPRPSLT
jgi:hypothetical protein